MKRYTIIGRTEKITLPVFEIKDIEAKIDTGAYTSSIDCSFIAVEDGVIRFKILDPSNKEFYKDQIYVFEKFEEVEVTSSNGQKEKRYGITIPVIIGGERFDTQFTLASRSTMSYPILIGRKSIPRGFLVDVHNFHSI